MPGPAHTGWTHKRTTGDPDGKEVLRRIKALPGFGEQKAKIFLALLGKQYGVTPEGWRAAAGDYGKQGTHMSVADVVDKGSLDQVRAYKKQMKAAAKAGKKTAPWRFFESPAASQAKAVSAVSFFDKKPIYGTFRFTQPYYFRS